MILMLGDAQDGVGQWQAGGGIGQHPGQQEGQGRFAAVLETQDELAQRPVVLAVQCQSLPGRRGSQAVSAQQRLPGGRPGQGEPAGPAAAPDVRAQGPGTGGTEAVGQHPGFRAGAACPVILHRRAADRAAVFAEAQQTGQAEQEGGAPQRRLRDGARSPPTT